MIIRNSANLTFENMKPLRDFLFLSASGGSPHLPVSGTRIVDYSGTTFSPAVRDFATLNLLICGNVAKGEQALKIAKFGFYIKSLSRFVYDHLWFYCVQNATRHDSSLGWRYLCLRDSIDVLSRAICPAG